MIPRQFSISKRSAWEGSMINRIVAGIRGNLVAWLALFVALGGTSLAASHYVINSTKQINPKVIKKLKGNRGPRGATGLGGPAGATGPAGAQGPAGTPNTANFFNKTESDGRYLGAGATAADSAKLGGSPASEFTVGAGGQAGRWQELIDGQKEASFMAIPGIGELSVECATITPATNVTLTAEAPLVFVMSDTIPSGHATKMESKALAAGKTITSTFAPPEVGTGQTIIQASTVAAAPTDDFVAITVSSSVTEGKCRFQANYTLATKTF
jgi:hypothetical protein